MHLPKTTLSFMSDPIHRLSLHRRSLLMLAATTAVTPSWAQFRVEISGVGAKQISIALPKFRDEDKAAQKMSQIIQADLERSGLFRIVEPAVATMSETSAMSFTDWSAKGAEAATFGSVAPLPDGRFEIRYKVWDVVKSKAIAGRSLIVGAGELRRAAHRVSDDVYEAFTGEKGIFSTRIAYVTKGAGKRKYTLWVADADGEGAVDALNSDQPIISPVWSPNGNDLAYVTFENGKPEVFAHEVASGKRRAIAKFKGSNSAPAWSPDGQMLAMTLSKDGGSQLYVANRLGENLRRLTNSTGIDTEATWGADGNTIYFVSDRGGQPQIYKTSLSGGNAERVTFQGSYNISPSVSPDGKQLAYISRIGGAFKLQVLNMATGDVTGLTDTSADESPSFAPNGRLIIYATRSGGRDTLMTTTLDGKIKAKLAIRSGDVREPSWGPFLR